MSKRIASARIEQTITLGTEKEANAPATKKASQAMNADVVEQQAPPPAAPDPLLIYKKNIEELEARLAVQQQEMTNLVKEHEQTIQTLKAEFLQEAQAQAVAELKEVSDRQQKQLESLFASISKEVDVLSENAEKHLVSVLIACLKKLVGDGYRDEAFRLAFLKNIVDQYSERLLVSIDVSSEDYYLLQAHHLMRQEDQQIVWHINDRLSMGDCIVTLEDSLLDVSLRQQSLKLQQVLEGLGNATGD